MARRSIWKGAIAFGMVVVPVSIFTATESKDLRFVTLHTTCHNRLRQKRFCPYHEVEVEQAEIARGYEYAKDQYVVMDEADFENVNVPSSHTIEITRFVDLASIDPIYFERSYALEPDNIGAKPFYLLKQALENTNRVGIAKVTLRQKEHLGCLRPFNHGMLLETMYYADEIRGNSELVLPEDASAVGKQEMEMAAMLIDQLSGPFEPQMYRDEYRTVLERTIEAKLTSGQPVTAAPVPPKGKIGDLMEALRASIEQAKEQTQLPQRVQKKPEKARKQTSAWKVRQKAS